MAQDKSMSRMTVTVIAILLTQVFIGFAWGLTVERRTTTLEVRQQEVRTDIAEIKADIKEVLKEVRK